MTTKERVAEALKGHIELSVDGSGYYYTGEIYADYRDDLGEKTAGDILQTEDPEMAFEDKLDEWYWETAILYRDELCQEIKKELFPDGSSAEDEEAIDSFIEEHVLFDYPRDHFLDEKLPVNIMLDTGDGNHDYVLNSVYPCWYGEEGKPIDEKAGIVWLAEQQGYNKAQLEAALTAGDIHDPHGFLETMRQELANLPSHMSTVTFLTKMTFRQLLDVNKALTWRDRQGKVYDARKHPDCGDIVLGKETMCGLYAPWDGGGSVLDVELEKDVCIPLKFIRCCLPDEGHWPHEYGIGNVYAWGLSAWKDSVKEINIPEEIAICN